MKKKILLLGFIFTIIFISNGYSQTVDEILSKYYEATGGKTNWDAIKSIKFTGYTSIMDMDIPYTQYVKRPALWLIEIYIQGKKILQGYDGKKGWIINPMMGSDKPTETDEETTKIFRNNALIGGRLYNIDAMGYIVDFIGKEDLDGKEVYKINVTDKDSAVTNFFIDANSYLILKTISKIKRMGNEIIAENYYSNYKKVNEIMIAFIMEQKLSGGQAQSQTVTIDKAELDLEIDDKIFKMPGE